MNQIYVRRLGNKITDTWIHICHSLGLNEHHIFKVVKEYEHGYQLEGMAGIWKKQSFETIPSIEVMVKTKDIPDAVINPNHYDMMGANTIEILAAAMTEAEWRGFCLGNTLKYRIRAGKKDNLQQDIDKANNYERLYEKHKHLCRKDKEKSEE